MKSLVLQRINDIISSYSISKNAFSNKLGMEQTTVNNQLLGKRGISIDLVLSTLNSFPEVSAEWLLRGIGNMLLTEQPQQKPSLQAGDTEAEIEKLKMQIARLEGQNDLLREQIGMAETKRSKTA